MGATRLDEIGTAGVDIEASSGECPIGTLIRIHEPPPRPATGAVEIDGRRCLLFLWAEADWDATPVHQRPSADRDGGVVVWFEGRGFEWLVPADPEPALPWE